MDSVGHSLLLLGSLLIAGMAVHVVAKWIHLPRVTLLILFGIGVGPSGLDWLDGIASGWFPLITHAALGMVGFLLGSELNRETLRSRGRAVLWTSIVVVITTMLLITPGLLFWVTPETALVLAVLAAATAPAASMDVVRESGATGPLSQTLLGVVAVDDAWALIAFSLALAASQVISGSANAAPVLLTGLWEIFGAIGLGLALGLPMTVLTGRIDPGEPALAEALGFVLLCVGCAELLGVSYLLASVSMGLTVTNLARHHSRAFREIEGIEWPFLILFFVFAGASLKLTSLLQAGPLLAAYVLLRVAARLIGGSLGAWAGGCDPEVRRWIGVALLPQAGVALGMALVAAERLPGFSEVALPTVIAATVIFELLGPPMTRLALARTGEIQPGPRVRGTHAGG